MSSHELARLLLEKPDLPLLVVPDGNWVGSIFISGVGNGKHLITAVKSREVGEVIIIKTSTTE